KPPRSTTRGAGGLGRIAAANHRRKTHHHRGALALLLEEERAGILRGRRITNRAIRLEGAVRHKPARVDGHLGNALAVEVADLLQNMVIPQRRRSTLTHRALVLIIKDRMALTGRQK